MQYAAFLRGINVGGRTVKMAELKTCFEGMGFEGVSTLLQSGNVMFQSPQKDTTKLKSQIEACLSETFHYPAKVQILPIPRLKQIVADYPFGVADDSQHDYVIFMEKGLERSIIEEIYTLAPGEKVRAGDGVVYWRVDKGSTLKSFFALWLTKAAYKDFNTNRNVKTLQKMLAKSA